MEVVDGWESYGEEVVEEFLYGVVMEGYESVSDLVRFKFEIGDSFFCLGEDGFLVGDEFEVVSGVGDLVFIGVSIDVGVEYDFCDFWYFVFIFVVMVFYEFGDDLFVVEFFEDGSVFVVYWCEVIGFLI